MKNGNLIKIALLLMVLVGNIFAAGIKTSSSSILENKSRYSHKNVIDGDIYTAWAEGNKNDGRNEWIQLDFNKERELHHIGIIPGYFKFNDKVGEVWFKNNRVREATLSFSDGSTQKIKLADMKQMQYFTVNKKTSYVRVKIDEIHKGTTWDDACISEIKPIFSDFKDVKINMNYGFSELPKNRETFEGLITIQTAYNRSTTREPLDISIIIDQSGSMNGEKIDYVKQALITLYKHLSNNDRVAITCYSSGVSTLLYPTFISDLSERKFNSIINGIKCSGATNLYSGLTQGSNLLMNNKNTHMKKRVLFLSDGLANRGETNPRKIAKFASSVKNSYGITISTFGVGVNYNEDLLERMADATQGGYYYIANPKESIIDFNSEIANLTSTLINNATITLTPSKGCTIIDIPGYEMSDGVDGSKIIKTATLSSGEKRTILVTLNREKTVNKIAIDGTLHYTLEGSSREKAKEFKEILRVSKTNKGKINRESKPIILKMETAGALKTSMNSYKNGNRTDAAKKLNVHIKELKKENRYLKSKKLTQEIQVLTDILFDLEKMDPNSSEGQNLIKSTKERSRNSQMGK